MDIFPQGLMVVLFACAAVVIFERLAADFPYPLFRSVPPGRRAPLVRQVFGSMVGVYAVYLIVGELVFHFSVSLPAFPTLNQASKTAFELAFLALIGVGLTRFVALVHSVWAYRVLMFWVAGTCALVLFGALRDPQALSALGNNLRASVYEISVIGPPQVSIALSAAFLGCAFEGVWLAMARGRQLWVSEAFIAATQTSTSLVKVGYGKGAILKAYEDVLRRKILTDGLWELCWLSLGETGPLCAKLVDLVAVRHAMMTGELLDSTGFDTLDGSKREELRAEARQILRRRAMILLPANPPHLRVKFKNRMGYRPGVLSEISRKRFLVVNRSVLVTSWPAYRGVLTPRGARDRALEWSTMYSVSEDPTEIHNHTRLFYSMWGQYQLSRLSSLIREVPDLSWRVLEIVIERSEEWDAEELRGSLAELGWQGLSPQQVEEAVSILTQKELVWATGERSVVRDLTAYRWQEEWLERFFGPRRG